MLFYLVVGMLFTIYALDLLVLVIISLIAKASEIRILSGVGCGGCAGGKELSKVDADQVSSEKPKCIKTEPEVPCSSSPEEASLDYDDAALTAPKFNPHVEVKAEVVQADDVEDASQDPPGTPSFLLQAPMTPRCPAPPAQLKSYQKQMHMLRGSSSEGTMEFNLPHDSPEDMQSQENTPGSSSETKKPEFHDLSPSEAPTTPLESDYESPEPVQKGLALSDSSNSEPSVLLSSQPYKKQRNEWPKVLVQLPMFNEEAHADVVIDRICKMRWPRDRLLVQVLDDSTKKEVRDRVDAAAMIAIEQGHPIQVMRRDNRQGYKAGAMVDGLISLEGLGYEFAAIFDADFAPPENFLEEAIAPLVEDDRTAFVQTRWSCESDSFLTWVQRINLGFHFDVEQRARSYMGWFFNFNGTAGVWRISAIEDAGGWQCDTVVEDMDLSLRCYLKGWKGTYLSHVDNPNELPSSLSAYKTQQFRWLSGPMQILAKMYFYIWTAKDISFSKRLNCYWFFTRYILFATVTIAVLSVPPVILWVDPVAIGYFKTWAMLSGLVGSEKSKKWKVTKKLGAGEETGFSFANFQKPYLLELVLGAYYLGMGLAASIAYQNWMISAYCLIMGLIFTTLSFGDNFL
eukprot:gene16094-22236_t